MKQLFILLFITASLFTNAQTEFKASVSKDAVMVGEPFILEYQMNKIFDNFKLADLQNFEVVSGPSTSMQQSINIINGEMVKTVSITYSYILKAKVQGTLAIPAAEIEIQGKSFYTDTIKIIVIEGNYQNPNEDHGKDINGTSRL
jgi:hypothetical protein